MLNSISLSVAISFHHLPQTIYAFPSHHHPDQHRLPVFPWSSSHHISRLVPRRQFPDQHLSRHLLHRRTRTSLLGINPPPNPLLYRWTIILMVHFFLSLAHLFDIFPLLDRLSSTINNKSNVGSLMIFLCVCFYDT